MVFVLESNGNISIKHEATETKKKVTSKISKKKKRGGFLNRYDFPYAGRDTVHQLEQIVPGVIKNASSEINYIAQQKINQIICQGGQEMERVPSFLNFSGEPW